MACKCLSNEALCGRQVTVFAEEELNRVANTVDSTVKIHPLAAHLDVSFVDVPLASDDTLALVETLQELRRKVNDPAVHGRMIDAQAAFGHHLFEITKAEIVSEVPAYAQQDHRSVELAAFEHRELPEILSPLCMIDIAITFAIKSLGAPETRSLRGFDGRNKIGGLSTAKFRTIDDRRTNAVK